MNRCGFCLPVCEFGAPEGDAQTSIMRSWDLQYQIVSQREEKGNHEEGGEPQMNTDKYGFLVFVLFVRAPPVTDWRGALGGMGGWGGEGGQGLFLAVMGGWRCEGISLWVFVVVQ